MNNYDERLRAEIEGFGITKLAKLINVARNTLYNWCEKGNVPLDKLMDMGQHGVDVQYVFSGVRAQNNEQSGYDFEDEFCLINAYDVHASAGGGALVQDARPKSRMAFRRDWIKLHGLKEKELCVIYAKGDSMEPTISNNDALLVDTSNKNMDEGFIYVMRNADMLWVKRVQWLGGWEFSLISDNDAYQPIQMEFNASNQIDVVGRVVNVSKEF